MRGAHWPHIEYPEVFNAILKEWLDNFKEKTVHEDDSQYHPFVDEL